VHIWAAPSPSRPGRAPGGRAPGGATSSRTPGPLQTATIPESAPNWGQLKSPCWGQLEPPEPRVDLLAIDELGYMELDRRGAELLFQVLTEREEKASVAIASNESFGGWTKTFTDPRLCAAIVDRLTFGGNIIETGTDSYRLAHAKTQQGNG